MQHVILLFCIAISTIVLLNYDVSEVSSSIYQSVYNHITKNDRQNSSEDHPFANCVLPDYNPFDKEIFRHVDIWKDWDFNCKEKESKESQLVKGKLLTEKKGVFCFGRCITRKSSFKVNYGKWQPAENTTFECDFVEAGCPEKNDPKAINYTIIHRQIAKQPSKNKTNSEQKRYNVFILSFDSHAMSQAYRNLPKTMTFLTKGLDGVIFPFLNKIGLNTRPNIIPFLFGKSIEGQDKSVFGLGVTPSDLGWADSCRLYFENNASLFHEFTKEGYKTLYGEDWTVGVLGYPNCYGFRNQPADHTFQPYILARNKEYLKSHPGVNCGSRKTKELYDYAQQFIDAYPEELKFAWIWSNDLSHNYESGSIPFDTYLYSFLWRNKDTFDNSFVFLISDHGLRFGGASNTKLGKLDVNNPMLTISIPKELRKTGILEKMRENARSLQTHYDTRATILDIVKYQPVNNFSARENLKMENERGNSYLREQIGERSCRSLPIPFQYCICQYKMETLPPTDPEAIVLGKAVISHINNLLEKRNVSNICSSWEFGKVVEVVFYVPKEKSNTFRIQVAASKPYEKAIFRTLVIRKSKEEFSIGRVDRGDKYGNRGDCQKTDLQPLCHCIQESTTTTTSDDITTSR